MAKNYNIGVDIGNTSVGWAVVESETQKLLRHGKRKLWGVRLFEEATTAETRRNFRSTRRRYDRRRYRIKLLQEEFRDEINKVDPDFFTKLQESFYREDDEKNKTIHISKGERQQAKEYNDKYKTIYHLRKALMEEDRKFDIRQVYLAIHHIIKYRGNFLYKAETFNVDKINLSEKIQTIFEQLYDYSSLLELSDDYSSNINYKKLEEAILDESKNDRKVKIDLELKGIFPKNFISEFTKMINGNKFSINKMLNMELEEKVELSFKTSDYDDKYDTYEDILKDNIGILQAFKELYDMLFLKQLFKNSDNTSISALMVEKYNQHKEDLNYLKQLFKTDRKIYNTFFKNKTVKGKIELCKYEEYVNNTLTNEDFIKEINKYLPDIFEKITDNKLTDKYNLEIKNKMENGEFIPRITDKENGKYPYQLNKDELNKIIENQGKYYKFLLNKYNDKTYRITRLLEFKIPYYVGPLTDEEKSPFAWLVRKKENVKITPYNFDEIVDKEETAEKFIKRMISNCTYIMSEKAMPSNSILYSKFKVINELKQISVKGEKLDKKIQDEIYENLFLKTNKTITDKMFKEYLHGNKDFKMYKEDIDVKGYSADGKFANNMKSYYDFFGEEGIFTDTSYTEKDAEQIIEWITIFEDKDILENKVRNNYPLLSDSQIKKIVSKRYSGWSSLSEKLLTEKYYMDKETKIKKSILDLMEETDKNFMQILNDEEYKFQDMIADLNEISEVTKINYSLVEELATSPATKRGIYQSLKVIDEIIKFMGKEPESIIIEMARSDEKKVRKDDRQKYLTNIYKGLEKELKDDVYNYQVLMSELEKYDTYKDNKINLEKLFLYFIQEGKSLYSQKPLNIEDLDSYEVDHIIPRTLIKDNSIDNKALVLRTENQDKAASFVLPREFRTDYMQKWWDHLKKCKLISNKKYNNLRRSYFKDEDISGFINRQLVETRQITKHVANILNNFYKETKVIYLKADLSHNYREKYKLYKFRDINDYHHAHDAYLAAVLGEYKEKYLKKKVDFKKIKELNDELIQRNDYKLLKYGYVINSLDYSLNELINKIIPNTIDEETGEVLTKDFKDADKFNEIIENTLYQNDILVSKKTEIRTGEFYNQTKSKKGNKGVPLKGNLPIEWYGSYTSLNPAYAVMVKYTKKEKEEKRLIGIPIYVDVQEKSNDSAKLNYIKNLLGLSDNDEVEIVSKKIPFFSLLDWDGQICSLVGATNTVEVCNAKEFHFEKQFMKDHKEILNKVFNNKKSEISKSNYNDGLNEIIKYIIEKIEKEYKLYDNLVPQLKEMVYYEDMNKLNIEQKEKVIIEIMKLLKCNSTNSNFKFLNDSYSSAFGKKHSRIITETKIIYKSVTGIKETSREL